ncbi:MAG: hypothetical protein AB3N23_02985 [Paracoccaceae bacterium]
MAEVSEQFHPQGAAFAPPITEDYDSETAALVRACLCPLFDAATGWKELCERLARRGFFIAIREGRLVVLDVNSRQQICTARYLGTNLRDLSARLGRPMIVARRDRVAAGEFLV